ncbi:hypothetical protein SAMN05428972_3818 [Rhodanobacter sp. OK091]|nr:hypothetical protein SAMN05428972_3818 [Rhodanobacter sp. OK091]
MRTEVVETFYSKDRKRRVNIVRQPDGSYSYVEEYYFKNELAEIDGWASLGGNPSLYDSLETARREVPFNVTWLASQRGEP